MTGSIPGVLKRLAVCTSAASFCIALGAGMAQRAVAAEPVRDEAAIADQAWMDELGAYYDAHPQLKTTRGSGWKPYNRAKWFYEQRMVNGEPVPIGARYRAWEQKLEVERTMPMTPRSTWFSLGPANFSGRILSLEFDPSNPTTVYAGAAGGGLWKSTDGGVNWAALTDDTASMAIGGVAVVPSNPNIVVIGTGEGTPNIDRIAGVGILRSTDGGTTWNSTNVTYSKANGHGFHAVKANPLTSTLLAGATDGLWRSTDQGATWTQVQIGGNWFDVVWKPGDANRCYTVRGGAGNGNGVKVSTDDGVTWAMAGTGQPLVGSMGKTKLAVSADEPTWVYAGFSHRTTSNLLGIYRTTNDGATWTLQANSPNMYGGQGWYNVSLAADPNDANSVISGGVELFKATDGGVTFDEIGGNVHVDHHAAAYRPGSPDNLFVGSDGGVWESTNDGTSWTNRNSTLVTYQFYDICVSQFSPSFIMGGTQDNGTDRWTGSTTWLEGLFADGMVCNVNPNVSNVIYAEIQFGDHYKSSNGGQGWQNIMNGIAGNGVWVTPVAEDQTPNNGGHLYTSTSNGIFRTTNGGSQWQNVGSHNANWIEMSPVDGNVVWTVAGILGKRSTNDGGSWTDFGAYGFFSGAATKVAAHPTDINSAFVTFSGYSVGFAHVAKTTDGGASWTNITGNLPDAPANALAVDDLDPNRIFVGTDVGVWVTTDAGGSWVPFETGLPNTVISDLEIQKSARKLVAGTHGRGAWEVDITVAPTGVNVATPNPLNLMFDPPSPNPVSSETVLRFAAKYHGEVTVSIFDVTGRLVNEVSHLPVGDGIIRMAPWYADDVPSGVYFAVLQAGPDKITRKIVVAK